MYNDMFVGLIIGILILNMLKTIYKFLIFLFDKIKYFLKIN